MSRKEPRSQSACTGSAGRSWPGRCLSGGGLAQRTIVGTLAGLLVHGAALAAGLSALLVASAVAYSTVKLAGAGYLLCLGGVQALRASRRPAAERPAAERVPAGIAVPRRASPCPGGRSWPGS